MAVIAPTRPQRVRGFDEPEQLEALIKEARRRAAAPTSPVRVLRAAGGECGNGCSARPRSGRRRGDGAPQPSPAAAPWEIKLAGAWLAYVHEHEQGVLYVTKPDGSGAQVLARCGQWAALCVIRDPVWSPDGGRIAFFRGPWNGENDLALYLIGLDGRGERRLAECGGIDGGCGTWSGSPRWSPDGSQIAFTRGGVLSIVEVASARVRRLTRCDQTRCIDVSPAWSPDQTAIAFTRSTGKAYALYRVSVSGPQLTRLAAEGMNPEWAPDGRTILVQTRRGIERVAADGSGRTLIAPALPTEALGAPSWSPDGSRVSYFWIRREKRGYRAEVWTMKPNGTEKKRLYRQSCCLDVLFRFKTVWSADGSPSRSR
jgi:Tol biopolymer transport system component